MASACVLLKGCGSQNVNQALHVDEKTREKFPEGGDGNDMVK